MTSLPAVPCGAVWRCVDLHLHTPGVTVLPGAELPISNIGRGLHLLLICDPERINEVIRHQGEHAQPLFAGREQHRDLELREFLPKALQEIRRELGCVIVAAHARDKNGILRERGAEKTAQLIGDNLLDALDHCEDAKTSLQGTGILPRTRLEALSCTLSSDPKKLEDIGGKSTPDGRRRLTWLKLSTVDAAALRLALHDPATRVRTETPASARHPRILSREVEGGFLEGLELRFNDDLTTLIGGCGASKSAILETLRYALSGPVFSLQSERLSLVQHALGSSGPGPPRHSHRANHLGGTQAVSTSTDALSDILNELATAE